MYGPQTLWALASVSKSTVYARQEAAASILNSAKRHEASKATQRLFHQFAEVADQFIRLCNHPGPDKRCAHFPLQASPPSHLTYPHTRRCSGQRVSCSHIPASSCIRCRSSNVVLTCQVCTTLLHCLVNAAGSIALSKYAVAQHLLLMVRN